MAVEEVGPGLVGPGDPGRVRRKPQQKPRLQQRREQKTKPNEAIPDI